MVSNFGHPLIENVSNQSSGQLSRLTTNSKTAYFKNLLLTLELQQSEHPFITFERFIKEF